MDIITVLEILIGLIIFIMILLVIIYMYLIRPKKINDSDSNDILNSTNKTSSDADKKKIENYGRFHCELEESSIMKFMEFDEIVDNMIVRKNKTQYIMILQCNGVNYDLMSEQEKISVEQGFIQFLNTLRFPIQLYVQSRTLNLKDIVSTYNEKIKDVEEDLEKVRFKINESRRMNDIKSLDMLEFEKRRKENVLSYGKELTEYVERLNTNKNILQQKTYLVVSFFVAELGSNIDNYSKDEIDSMCFSELYTRAQNISSSLNSAQVTSRILDSEELAELLYIAYNRDESEVYSLSKAIEAQYDSLYSTGKDVLKKKQEKLDKEIHIESIDLATNSILKADKQKQLEDIEKERNKINKVKEKASDLLDMYENQLDKRVYEIAKENIENYDGSEEKVKVKKVKKKIKKEKSLEHKDIDTTEHKRR